MTTYSIQPPRLPAALDLSGPAGGGAGDGAPGEETLFGSLLQEMTSQRDSERDDAHPGASCAGAGNTPALHIPGEATRLGEAGVKRLVQVLWTAVMSGEESAAIKIDPAEMGTLTLNIRVAGRGVFVEAQADDPRVLTLLRASLAELAAGLAGRGLELMGFHVLGGRPQDRDERANKQQAASQPGAEKQQLPAMDTSRRSFIEVVI